MSTHTIRRMIQEVLQELHQRECTLVINQGPVTFGGTSEEGESAMFTWDVEIKCVGGVSGTFQLNMPANQKEAEIKQEILNKIQSMMGRN